MVRVVSNVGGGWASNRNLAAARATTHAKMVDHMLRIVNTCYFSAAAVGCSKKSNFKLWYDGLEYAYERIKASEPLRN